MTEQRKIPKEEQEKLRNKMMTPLERWNFLTDAINWAESQLVVPRNSMEVCLEQQAKKLKSPCILQ